MIAEYARLDHESLRLGRPMGKNDLWIAAIAAVQGATLVTTDQDFDHLNLRFLKVERIDVASLVPPTGEAGTP